MKTTVSAHKLFGHRDTLRHTKHLAPAALRLVGRAVPGRMPRVEIVVTTARGMAELATDAELALAGCEDERIRNRHRREALSLCRRADGRAVASPDGSVLVLLNAATHRTAEEVAQTLVHELTHAMQYSRPGVLERHRGHLRDRFGIVPQSWRKRDEHSRRMRQEEEAYAAEHLARQLTPAAAA